MNIQRTPSSVYRSQRGFTLVELLIYMGLLSVFLVVLTDILVQTLQVRTESSATTYVTSDANFIRDRLNYDVRASSAIVTPSSRGSATASLSLTISGVTSTYSLSGNNLVLTRSGDTQQLNTSDVKVTQFSVTRFGNGAGKDTVTVTYSLESFAQDKGKPLDAKSYTVTVGTR